MDAPVKVGIGTPLSRVDGEAKVTGRARYAAEHAVPGLLHGVAVTSAKVRGHAPGIGATLGVWNPGECMV